MGNPFFFYIIQVTKVIMGKPVWSGHISGTPQTILGIPLNHSEWLLNGLRELRLKAIAARPWA